MGFPPIHILLIELFYQLLYVQSHYLGIRVYLGQTSINMAICVYGKYHGNAWLYLLCWEAIRCMFYCPFAMGIVGLWEPTLIYIQDDLFLLHDCQELDGPLLAQEQVLGGVLRQRDPLDTLVLHTHIISQYTLNSGQFRYDAHGVEQCLLHLPGIPYILLIRDHILNLSSNGITMSTNGISLC